MQLDFNATSYMTLCGLPKEHAQAFSNSISVICKEITADITPYLFMGIDDEGKERQGIHKGRVLKRIFETMTSENEQLLVLLSLDNIMGQLVDFLDRKNAMSKMGKFFKQVAEKLSDAVEKESQA